MKGAGSQMSDKMRLSAIILTLNEEVHIRRCIHSISAIAQKIYVVDSFSTDRTIEIAESLGARVFQHEFINHAAQLNWALLNLPIDTDWVMRIDADERLTLPLSNEIHRILENTEEGVSGFLVNRCTYFYGRPIRHGGRYPQYVLRLWRRGCATCESSWMDEHMVVNQGEVRSLKGELIDDNKNNITWWIEKHNRYATREAIVQLNEKYNFLSKKQNLNELSGQARVSRWLKEKLYAQLPLGWRALFFFFYRLVFRLGFLDGRSGVAFHFLQGCWYRLLVDIKVSEVERRMKSKNIDCEEAIREELRIEPHF